MADSAPARDALVERLFEGVLGMIDVHAVYMADRLGVYEALAGGHASEAEIAAASVEPDDLLIPGRLPLGVERFFLRH